MASNAATPSSPSYLLTPFPRTETDGGGGSGGGEGSSTSSSSDQKSKDGRLLRESSSGVHRTKLRVPATIVPWKSGGGGGGGVTAVVDPEVGGRRAIAIKRVLHDDDTNTVREFSLFVTARGDTLFTQLWTPVSAKIRGLVVLMHGLNEHSGRYNDFARELNANGFKVYGMDWIGSGLSVHWCKK
uniref:Serine aminopeptidase S33 domain-containing protein n=1 Tax=Salix viminalis TaxID=40686 RepID=A0A6N2KMB9_SALVM